MASTSSDILIPRVFIVPPEEDHSPPWCCFDANGLSPRTSDPRAHDVGNESAATCSQYDLREPLSLSGIHEDTGSIVDVFMISNDIDTELEEETDTSDSEDIQTPDQENYDLNQSVGNDSEIIEIVKVRYTTDSQAVPTKTSMSLRDRASSVFKTLRAVGKGSIRSKSKSSVISHGEPGPPKSTASLSRHGSLSLSQIFSSMTTTPQPYTTSPTSTHTSIVRSPMQSRYPASLRNAPPPSHAHIHTSSPTPSSETIKIRQRSMMSLHRIFSFSNTDEPIEKGSELTEAPTGLETLTDDFTSVAPEYRKANPQRHTNNNLPALEPGDVSFEMKLDSLHFDDLSFDVDRF
ncbi:hypothetical protein H0H93_012881 [Arthromyces matolae]|nr:hypothetical protein H0H93_012881 [Arthromyces matolae]